ncbi:MAG: AmmeMemoRadiSam system radical SAM enzyme [Spirochaetaceae bacterium]|nr:MAG: AmmeMemoRadiSam system radical SAM enzyme [Spirochaetaceae bacterium]
MNPRFFEATETGKIQCRLCPNSCLIASGKFGVCRVRHNRDGDLELPFYGRLSAIAIDPIEKKPLYHFHPGSSILSIGFVGCSFHCPFCQNYHIAHDTSYPTEFVSPEQLVELCEQRRSFGISYTYSEPIVHLEYVLDSAALARKRGLKNVLVSNGYINPEPAEELLDFMDAANIDFKSWNPEFYRREIGGKVEEVKRFLEQAYDKISLEVTTLVIPTKNDSPEEIESIARFLASLSADIPYHLSAYYPQHQYRIPPTPPSTLHKLAEVARKHLSHVYLGNVGVEETNTNCPSCGNLLIRRRGYSVSVRGIENGRCRECEAEISIAGV